MGIGQQQPIRDTVDEICTDVSRTIYAIFSENMNDNTLELLRLKLDVQKTVGNLNKFVKVLRKHNKEILINMFIEQLIEEYTTEEQRKAFIKEVCEIILDSLPKFNIEERLYRILNKKYDTEEYRNIFLHLAAEQGNLNAVKYFVEKGGNISSQNEMGYTPLHLAAKQGNLDIVKYLIEKGADVDVHQGGWSYSTALHLAAENGHLDIVKYLIERGANPKATDSDGKNPLQRAAQSGHSDIVEYLKKRVQQVTQVQSATERQNITTKIPQVTKEQQVNDNKTLQEFATFTGEKQFIEEQGSDFIQETLETLLDFLPDFRGELSKILKRLFETSKEQVIEGQNITTEMPQVIKGQNVTIEGRQVATEVPQVIGISQTTEGQQITERQQITTEAQQTTEKQQVTTEVPQTTQRQQVTEDYSNMSLHDAAEQGNLNAVKYFVENGIDINSKNERGETSLHLAAEQGNLDIVKYLVEKGADVNAKGWHGSILLGYAIQGSRYSARGGELDVVKYLVEKGAGLNLKDDDYRGFAPLHYAADLNGRLDIVKYLIDRGADINIKSDYGSTPLHIAAKGGRYVAWGGELDVVKYLVEQGADFCAKNNGGKTPLHYAAETGVVDIVKYLVEQGADGVP